MKPSVHATSESLLCVVMVVARALEVISIQLIMLNIAAHPRPSGL